MKRELTLVEALQIEIDYEERNYEHAISSDEPIEYVIVLQKKLEYLNVTLEAIRERYNLDERE